MLEVMTEHTPVKEKSPPPTRQRSAVTLSVLAALVALGMGLPVFIGGCEAGEDETAASTEASSKRVLLNITVEDATQQRPADRFVLTVPGDSASWAPDLSWGSTSRAFGEYQVGRKHVFYVHPDSASGPQIEVPFEMQPDMISGVAASKLHVTVYDDSVVAEGPAIPDHRQRFER